MNKRLFARMVPVVKGSGSMSASQEASRDFAAAFRTMVEWVHATGVPGGANAVVALVHDHSGPTGWVAPSSRVSWSRSSR